MRSGRRRSAAAVLLATIAGSVVAGAACSSVLGIGDLPSGPSDDASAPRDGATETGTDAATGDAAGDERSTVADAQPEDADADAGPLRDARPEMDAPPSDAAPDSGCPSGRGPTMVNAGPFCIDSTEATNAQYEDFLVSDPSTAGQPAACSWNTTYLPANGWTYDPTLANYPIASVDWCDAYAFCRWAGKHMCGAVDGGAQDFAAVTDLSDEHYYACSRGGLRIFPYGNTPDLAACNVYQTPQAAVPVASFASCEGGIAGLFDIVGNVEEWQDSCDGDAGRTDSCADGLGTYDHGTMMTATSCTFTDTDFRATAVPQIGIRCCWP